MAHTPVQLGPTRLPMMDGALLDARTRPPEQGPTPIWLGHRLERQQPSPPPTPARRARAWIERLAGRTRD